MNIPKLGSVLEEMGRLNPEVLEEALEAQAENGERLGQILIQQKKITEAELLEALAIQFDLEIIDRITDEQLRFDLVEQLPIQYLKNSLIFPFQTEDGILRVAVNDPLNLEILDDTAFFTARRRSCQYWYLPGKSSLLLTALMVRPTIPPSRLSRIWIKRRGNPFLLNLRRARTCWMKRARRPLSSWSTRSFHRQ